MPMFRKNFHEPDCTNFSRSCSDFHSLVSCRWRKYTKFDSYGPYGLQTCGAHRKLSNPKAKLGFVFLLVWKMLLRFSKMCEKTVLITTQAQPPPFLTTSIGATIKVKEKESGHKWLGCMLSAGGSKHATLDIDYHLQSASRTFFANKSIFLSRNVSIRNKLKFFDAIVTPIACFGAGPRCIHSADMVKFDIHFRRMIRCVVGAPSSICWRDPWHEILHIWNQRVREMVEACHIKTWAENCAYQHWKFACYIMSLPP